MYTITTQQAAANVNAVFIPSDKQKTTDITIYIHTPFGRGAASKNAVLAQVFKRGSRLCPNMEQEHKYLESLYGAEFVCNAANYGCDGVIAATGEVISDDYALDGEETVKKMLDFLLAAVFEPVTDGGGFLAEYVYAEKKNAADKARALKNNKAAYAKMRLNEIMFADTPAAVSYLGYPEDIAAITAEELYKYYKSIITGSPIDIVIAGKCDEAAISERLNSYFKAFDFTPAKMPVHTAAAPAEEVREIFEEDNVEQGKLSIGFTTSTAPSDADFAALQIANSIFGGGVHSKLFANVREKLSLAYYANSSINSCSAAICASAGIETGDYERARDEIFAQLYAMQAGEITDAELANAKASVINTLDSYYDSNSYRQSYYILQRITNSGLTIETAKAACAAVTKDEVVAEAKKIKPHTVYFLKRGDK